MQTSMGLWDGVFLHYIKVQDNSYIKPWTTLCTRIHLVICLFVVFTLASTKYAFHTGALQEVFVAMLNSVTDKCLWSQFTSGWPWLDAGPHDLDDFHDADEREKFRSNINFIYWPWKQFTATADAMHQQPTV